LVSAAVDLVTADLLLTDVNDQRIRTQGSCRNYWFLLPPERARGWWRAGLSVSTTPLRCPRSCAAAAKALWFQVSTASLQQ